MKIDLYTKFILTVIAISLVWIASRDNIENAIAQETIVAGSNSPIKVAICNVKGSHCADIAIGEKLEVDED